MISNEAEADSSASFCLPGAAMKENKTNVMRLLDEAGITYQAYSFPLSEAVDGITMAKLLNKDPDSVFKTLVARASSGFYYVFVIPVSESLNLKKAALSSGEKSISMIPQKELLPLTGYVHGGCSPIGMKKKFKTFLDETAVLFDRITFSAGKIGYQVELSPEDLLQFIDAEYKDLIE